VETRKEFREASRLLNNLGIQKFLISLTEESET